MIRMNDFAAEPDDLRQAQLSAMERVVSSGSFILGKEVEQFEQTWASVCGIEYCIGVGNGTEAIELGLRAIGVGPGDEVITTTMTAIATVMAIIHAGATPVLADVEKATALLDPAAVRRQITPKTKAVLLVHLYGQMPDMNQWVDLCEQSNIHLLEDCAQAHGASHGGRAGTFGTWGAFSFYPTKNLGARGDAGALITNSESIAARVRTLRNLGTPHRAGARLEPALNSRLDELQAAILSVRLKWLKEFNARRQEIARTYLAHITNPRIELMPPPVNAESHVYHLFVVRSAERDRLARFLEAQGVQTLVHYETPAHGYGLEQVISDRAAGLANAELHARQCLSLPCHPQLGDDEVGRIIGAVNQFR